MRRLKKQERLPLNDEKLNFSKEEIISDLIKRIKFHTGPKQEIQDEDTIRFTTRDMTFCTIKPEDDCVKVICELPYDRILDMSRKCEVQNYAAEDNTDIVTYRVKTKFDVQYAVSIVQQSYIYRTRLKL